MVRRTHLLLALWGGFWLLTLGLMLVLLWLPLAQLHNRSTLALSGFISLLAALILLYACRPHGWANAKSLNKNTPPLAPELAAPLYKMVEKLGRQLGIAAPVSLYLIDNSTAYIYATRDWRGKIKNLNVGIGLPLLGTLSEAELGSVIAHEYGHFFAGKLPLGPWVYRTRLWLINAVTDIDDSAFLPDILLRGFARWFLRLSHSVSREQEFAADMLAAHGFGVIATRAALEKIHLITPMWSAYLEYELHPAIQRGARLPVYDGFRRFCKPNTKRAVVQAAIHYAINRPAAEFDSHPALAERVSALTPGAKPAYPPLADCLHLLGGEINAENLWYAQYSEQKLHGTNWDNFGTQILQPAIERAYADSWMNPAKLAFSDLPGMVRGADDLWDKIRPDQVTYLSPQGKRNYVLAALEEWATACLIYRGFNAKVSPGQAVSMERGEQVVQPAELIIAAISGTLKSAFLKQFDSSAESV